MTILDQHKLPWGEQLKYYRELRGLTQENIADIIDPETGCPIFNGPQYISALEKIKHKKVPPQLNKTILIAKKLNLGKLDEFYFVHTARTESASAKIKAYDRKISGLKKGLVVERRAKVYEDSGMSRKKATLVVAVKGLSENDVGWISDLLEKSNLIKKTVD